MRKYTPEQQITVFWSHVNKDGSIPMHCPELGKCWEWTAGKNGKGYGTYQLYKRSIGTHRLSWQLINGEIPDGLNVLHKCDNPPCCNPAHLFLGTHKANANDRERKGRGNQPKLEKHNKAKLTVAIVREIRQRYAAGGITMKRLAIEYNVHETNIGFIIKHITWKLEE